MYDSSTIDQIKRTSKVPFAKKWFDILTDLFLPAIIIVTAIIVLFKFGIKDYAQLIASVIMFVVGTALLYLSIKKIKYNSSFYRITTKRNVADNIEWVQKNMEQILKVNSGQIFESDQIAIIQTKMSWFSWGEIITIIFDGNDLLINSRNRATTLSLYHDKKNIDAIAESLKK